MTTRIQKASRLFDLITHVPALAILPRSVPELELPSLLGLFLALDSQTSRENLAKGFAAGAFLSVRNAVSRVTARPALVPSGAIVTGSFDTFVTRRPAARVGDMVSCHVPNVVATGSQTIRINRRLATRVAETTTCMAKVATGADSVEYGGPVATTNMTPPTRKTRPPSLRWLNEVERSITARTSPITARAIERAVGGTGVDMGEGSPFERATAPSEDERLKRSVHGQVEPMSCALACMKMVLDAVTGTETPEGKLRIEASRIRGRGNRQLEAARAERQRKLDLQRRLNPNMPPAQLDLMMRGMAPEPKIDPSLDGYDAARGTSIFVLPRMFEKRHVKTRLHADMDVAGLERATAGGRPAILRVEGPRGGHFVVVDAVTEKNGEKVLHVRDPNPPRTGRRYEVPASSAASDFYGNGSDYRMDSFALTVEEKKR